MNLRVVKSILPEIGIEKILTFSPIPARVQENMPNELNLGN
jgi:hypothetical protein